MDEYQQTLALENKKFHEVLELLKIIVAGIVAVLIVLIISGALLLAQHTGPRVCDECGSTCVRNGPTHFELLLGETQ